MNLPRGLPPELSAADWLQETHREDRILVTDPGLFRVDPYRPRSLAWAVEHEPEWNREDVRRALRYQEYNWVEGEPGARSWQRCYANPIDGTHRAAAARELGVPVWVTIHAYFFELRGVETLGLPKDRLDLGPWLVPAGSSPRALHEVVALPVHRPSDLLRLEPTEDGLLGFSGDGGVARVRTYMLSERAVVLVSPVPKAIGASPAGTIQAQCDAIESVWNNLFIGDQRHPLDIEWWLAGASYGRRWSDAMAGVAVARSESGVFVFKPSPRPLLEDEVAPRSRLARPSSI